MPSSAVLYDPESAAWLRFGKPSVLGAVTGMVAGLGTITPASGFVGPQGALIIGLTAGVVTAKRELIPNKLRLQAGAGAGWASKVPTGVGNFIGWEANLGVVWTPKVFLDLELHAAYLSLGDFYDWDEVNGGLDDRPLDHSEHVEALVLLSPEIGRV